ncbi:MAG: hypothetical protein HOK06_06045, partial [Rhodospirillaceae bacterium]|nr:hypothetical protein [Rhodospirillaceae bacterium]
ANVLLPAIGEDHYTVGLTYAMSDEMELGWSAYYSPGKTIKDSGQGNGYSAASGGTELTMQQHGTQLSVKYNF